MPTAFSCPFTHTLAIQMSACLFIKQVHCLPIRGHWQEKDSRPYSVWLSMCVCVFVCQCQCQCFLASWALLKWGHTIRHTAKKINTALPVPDPHTARPVAAQLRLFHYFWVCVFQRHVFTCTWEFLSMCVKLSVYVSVHFGEIQWFLFSLKIND